MEKGEKEELLDRSTFFASAYRAVILGNPGAGKSTLAIKLCYDLAHNYAQRLFAGRKELTPILVTLRQYGADRKERRCSLLEFIETEAKTTYQQPSVPQQAFHYLLLTGRAMVIFDGLDELLDTSYRQEIRSDIELFCHLYPSVPILVTSREVGYGQAPLNQNLFNVFRIAPFKDDQVQAYVQKWFAIADAEDIVATRRQGIAEKFLKDSLIVPDLRTNPLMLALLCTIYREEGYIPRYRPDVYEKCALMLFERWDKSRHIYMPPLPEEHVRPLMEYLANWIYKDEQLRAGITTMELAMKATEYLHYWLYEDQCKAERTAREFIAFCTGRAWVFTDTGTQKDGENLYQFAHSTFLEYFAASHLVRASRAPDGLLVVLMPHIIKEEWDVMAQLAFQLYSKQNVGAGDELLMTLVEKSCGNTSKAGLNLLSFATRCLQFIILRPQVRRAITEACVDWCITWGCEQLEKGVSQENEMTLRDNETLRPISLFKDLDNIIPENRITVTDTLSELLIKCVNSGYKNRTIIAMEIVLYWEKDIFVNIANNIYNTSKDSILKVYPESLLLCQAGVWRKRLHVKELINWHGVKSLFRDSHFIINESSGITSIFSSVHWIAELNGKKRLDSPDWELLKDVGSILLSHPLPWIKREDLMFYSNYPMSRIISDTIDALNNNVLFSIFACYFTLAELDNEFIKRQALQHFHPFYELFLARFEPDLMSKVQETLDHWHFSAEQQDFIWRWVRKEITLVTDE